MLTYPLIIACGSFAVNVKAVPIQVALMAGVSLAVLLAFSFFRPREKKVYAPKVKYRLPEDEDAPPPQVRRSLSSLAHLKKKGRGNERTSKVNAVLEELVSSHTLSFLSPTQINNGFFSWLSPLLSKSDLTLVDTIGVDAVAFLQFLSLLRWAFLSIAVLVCGVLIPFNGGY